MAEGQQNKPQSGRSLEDIGCWQQQLLLAEESLQFICSLIGQQDNPSSVLSARFEPCKREKQRLQLLQALRRLDRDESARIVKAIHAQHQQLLSDVDSLQQLLAQPIGKATH